MTSRPLALCLLALALAVWPTRRASANGAFPESDAILLPADRPRQIILSTNFGLIVSDDDGAVWQWTCERPETAMGTLYTVGPPPDDRLFSLSPDVGLAVSTDGSCSWRRSGGALAATLAADYFPDPTDPTRVLAIVSPGDEDGGVVPASLLQSTDGGEAFGATPLYSTTEATLAGLEIARSDPRVVYLAGYRPGPRPLLLRSGDGGATWASIDLEPALGPNTFRIIAIDPDDAGVVYLRVLAAGGDVLAVTRDGGATFAQPVTVTGGALAAFARLASGAVLVAGLRTATDGAITGIAWRSSDGGRSFQDWTIDARGGDPRGGAPQPRVRALAERGGKLYVAGRNYDDGWAIAVSFDEGRTIQPLARYDQVSAIKACAKQVCQLPCDYQAGLTVWSPEVCNPPPDGGQVGGGGGGSGCRCRAAPPGREGGPGLEAVALAILFAGVMRRRSRRLAGDLRRR